MIKSIYSMDKDTLAKSKILIEKVKTGKKFLVIPDSSRIDYDCLSSGLATKWWLNQMGAEVVNIYLFANIPDYLANLPDLDQIQTRTLKEIDFTYYDFIFLLDTPKWDRVLTYSYKSALEQVPIERFISIDHHEIDTIYNDNPDNTILVKEACTAKVLHDYFIKPSGVRLDKKAAEYIYTGLLGDTQCFRYGIREDTFEFAGSLIQAGVNHQEIYEATTVIPKEMIDFTVFAIQHTDFYPDLKLTILKITDGIEEEIIGRFGENWQKEDLIEYYKEIFLRRVQGYDYGIIFRNKEGMIRANWRSRNHNTVNIMQVLTNAGMNAGGHRNSGGAFVKGDLNKVINVFKDELNKALAEPL